MIDRRKVSTVITIILVNLSVYKPGPAQIQNIKVNSDCSMTDISTFLKKLLQTDYCEIIYIVPWY